MGGLTRRAVRLWRGCSARGGGGLRAHREAVAGRDWPAAVLLITALATVFFFSGYDRGQFYRAQQHDIISRNNLAVAANLSPEHGFLQFKGRFVDPANGELAYNPYHRYPILGYALIKLVGLPFGHDISAHLYASCMLMLAFFCGAALMAFLSLRRLTGERAVALTATLLAFSSYPLLYYSDVVAVEVMDLFAVMLAFHGVAVHLAAAPAPAGSPRRRGGVAQLYAKMCAAPLLGWHVYGLLLPLLLVVLPHAVCTRDWRRLRQYALLGVAVVGVGLVVIAFNLVREYQSLGAAMPFHELPSLRSALSRTAVVPFDYVGNDGWGVFIEQQFRQIGGAALPWALAAPLQGRLDGYWHWLGAACVVAALAAICLPGTRHRTAWSGLALCGWGWAVLCANSVNRHHYEVVFHVGVPLAAFALLLTRLARCAWHRGTGAGGRRGSPPGAAAKVAMVAVALVLFVISSWLMGRVGVNAQRLELNKALMADVREIRRHIHGKVVYVPWPVRMEKIVQQVDLAGSIVALQPVAEADFVLAIGPPSAVFQPSDGPRVNLPTSRSLTPRNRVLFLYDEPDVYHATLVAARGAFERHAHGGQPPAIASQFDVHHLGNALLYAGEGDRCVVNESLARWSLTGTTRFFVHVFPVDVDDLAEDRRRFGFASLDFVRDPFWTRDGRCYAVRPLPKFPIGRIRTGQFVKRAGLRQEVWAGSFSPRGAGGEDDPVGEYQRIAAVEPAVRAAWDVHVLRGSGAVELAFLKTPCARADAAARFFLHVVPADAKALPAAGRPPRDEGFVFLDVITLSFLDTSINLHHDNLDFDFLDRGGVRFDGKCIVRARLPEYDIAAVRTGQYEPPAGELWSVEVPLRMPRAKPVAAPAR